MFCVIVGADGDTAAGCFHLCVCVFVCVCVLGMVGAVRLLIIVIYVP